MSLFKIISLGIVLSLVTACRDGSNNTSNYAEIQRQHKANEIRMQAEKLALDTEYQLGSTTFMNAEDSFNQALTIDPDNKRAKFYSNLLSPILAYRGYVVKVQAIFNNKEINTEMEKQISGLSPEIQSFLTYGYGKFGTAQEVQDFNQYVANLRLFAEKSLSEKYPENFRLYINHQGGRGVFALKPESFQGCTFQIKDKTNRRVENKSIKTDMEHVVHALETFKELVGIFGCSQAQAEKYFN